MSVKDKFSSVRTFEIDDLSSNQILVLVKLATEKLNWRINSISDTALCASSNKSTLLWNEKVQIRIDKNELIIQSNCNGYQLSDLGKNKSNVINFITTFHKLESEIGELELNQKYESLKLQFEETTANPEIPISLSQKITGFLSLIVPTKGYCITPILIDLNILVYLIMVLSGVDAFLPKSDSLLTWGANFRPSTLDGEWWRLLSNCFLHIGMFHLLMNMYALMYIGILLEPYLGRTRFLVAYLLTGIMASVNSLCWHELTISAGASGAIFGMYGVFLSLLSTNLIDKKVRFQLLSSIGIFVIYNLVFGMKQGIDNAAHLAGLISGIVIGYFFSSGLKEGKYQNSKYIFQRIALLSIVVISISWVVCKNIQSDMMIYQKKMEVFFRYEAFALQVYKMPQQTPDSILLKEIKNNGIYYWNENLRLMTELDTLKLPEEIHKRNNTLISYCQLRIEDYKLIYKAIEEHNPTKYHDKIDNYNKEIQSIVNNLTDKKE